MKFRLLFSAFLLFISFNLFSQIQGNLLKVKGESVVYSIPEDIVFNMSISVKDSMYDACSKKLVDRYNKLLTMLIKCGIQKDIITTTGIDISTSYERDEDGKRIFVGYSGSMNVILEMKFDQSILNRLISALRNKDIQQTFNLDFKLSKEQKERLLELAIQNAIGDAKNKAMIISKNLGLNLIEITEINYGYVASNFDELIEEGEEFKSQEEFNGSENLQLNPNKMAINKNISIIWRIEK